MSDQELYQDHPAMFRNNPIGFILAVLLVGVGIGVVILLVWYLRCLGTTLTVTESRTILRRGILSKYTNEVWHENVRNVQIGQSFLQRIFNVGTIGISSAGQSGVEIEVVGIPDPTRVQQLIDAHR